MAALFYSGLRPIELFALGAADVDLENRWLVVKSSKTGEPRGVPIHEFLVPLLRGLVDRGDPLFRTPSNVAYPIFDGSGGQIKTAILGARRRSGLTTISDALDVRSRKVRPTPLPNARKLKREARIG
jgi:integrase/recombinase XerD